MFTTRFAPSPTGRLHLGHAYAALFACEAAQRANGNFLLRIEDIDPVRCKPEYAVAISEDLMWLGLKWPEPIRFQSQHIPDYTAALDKLKERGLVYPCFCTRREVEAEAQNAAHAPHGEGAIYAGTCRNLSASDHAARLQENPKVNWRMDVRKALAETGTLFWHDRARGKIEAQPQGFGDVVVARKDVPTSYHLSVTVDDHLQGVTLVTRGEDLFSSTHIHRLLQALLGYATPEYHHHPLLLDESGKRYAKRDQAVTLRALREKGVTAEAIIRKWRNE